MGLGGGCSVCFLGAVLGLVCVCGSVFAGLACACMLFTVRMYVGWRALWMLLKVVSVCGLVFFIVDVTNMWG